MEKTKKIKNDLLKYTIIFCVLVLFFCIRFFMLSKSEFPNGLDGYFYALQAKSFALNGVLENPDLECGYYLCGFFTLLTGNAIIGVKIWSSLAFICLLGSIIYLLNNLIEESNKKFFASLFALFLIGAGFFTTPFNINYINNLTGLIFLFFYIGLLINIFKNIYKSKKTVIKLILCFLLLILCLISHKVCGVYALCFTAVYLINYFFAGKRAGKILFISFVVLLIFIALYIVLKQSARFRNSFDFPSLPIFHKEFISSAGKLGKIAALETSVYYLLGWILVIFTTIKNKKIGIEFILTFILFFPFWNLGSDMGYRMVLNGTLLGIPLIIYQLCNLISIKTIKSKAFNICYTVLFVILLSISFCIPSAYEPKFDPPYTYYKKVVEKINLEDDTLLIAHQGLNHVYTYYHNLKDCLNWLPNFEFPKNKIWRIAYGADKDRIESILHLDNNLDDEILVINQSYLLIKENLWQEYLNNEDKDIVETLNNWFNPYKVRPDYIRKGKQTKKKQ